jgi:UPF0176 protein
MTNQILHSSFYRLTPVADPQALSNQILIWAKDLLGSLVVASQGVSGAVAGAPAAVAHFERALRQSDWLADVAHRIRFRHSGCGTVPFGRLSVSVKPSLVTLGLPSTGLLPEPDQDDITHLDPHAWRALMARGDCVVLDNRNHFEYRVGHFKGAIDPEVHHFRDFVAFVEARAPVWRAQGRSVAMYCTGGIRCDVTAPWLRSLGLEVWQLDGGILNYFETIPTAEENWEGDCFVFDNRIAVNPRLEESSISAEAVYDPAFPEERWRLDRARQLERSVQADRAMQLDLAVDSGGGGDAISAESESYGP